MSSLAWCVVAGQKHSLEHASTLEIWHDSFLAKINANINKVPTLWEPCINLLHVCLPTNEQLPMAGQRTELGHSLCAVVVDCSPGAGITGWLQCLARFTDREREELYQHALQRNSLKRWWLRRHLTIRPALVNGQQLGNLGWDFRIGMKW